jgi:hypothetical protein
MVIHFGREAVSGRSGERVAQCATRMGGAEDGNTNRNKNLPIADKSVTLLWWDYLEGGSKSMADCLDFDENFELGKI